LSTRRSCALYRVSKGRFVCFTDIGECSFDAGKYMVVVGLHIAKVITSIYDLHVKVLKEKEYQIPDVFRKVRVTILHDDIPIEVLSMTPAYHHRCLHDSTFAARCTRMLQSVIVLRQSRLTFELGKSHHKKQLHDNWRDADLLWLSTEQLQQAADNMGLSFPHSLHAVCQETCSILMFVFTASGGRFKIERVGIDDLFHSGRLFQTIHQTVGISQDTQLKLQPFPKRSVPISRLLGTVCVLA
jgi:hypothetical protein